jgi:dihydroxyacetone kinase-like protein
MRVDEVVLDTGFVQRWLDEAAAQIHRNRDFLTQLDAAIGDADHGVNMDRGFSAARDGLVVGVPTTPGALLDQAGATLVLRVGGAAGPLFGTALRRAAAALGEAEILDGEDAAARDACRPGRHPAARRRGRGRQDDRRRVRAGDARVRARAPRWARRPRPLR